MSCQTLALYWLPLVKRERKKKDFSIEQKREGERKNERKLLTRTKTYYAIETPPNHSTSPVANTLVMVSTVHGIICIHRDLLSSTLESTSPALIVCAYWSS
jgi:hypothetical protein